MAYCGQISGKQIGGFIDLLYELEIAKITSVHIVPSGQNDLYNVTLMAKENFENMLDASFSDGALYRNKWGNKFKKE